MGCLAALFVISDFGCTLDEQHITTLSTAQIRKDLTIALIQTFSTLWIEPRNGRLVQRSVQSEYAQLLSPTALSFEFLLQDF